MSSQKLSFLEITLTPSAFEWIIHSSIWLDNHNLGIFSHFYLYILIRIVSTLIQKNLRWKILDCSIWKGHRLSNRQIQRQWTKNDESRRKIGCFSPSNVFNFEADFLVTYKNGIFELFLGAFDAFNIFDWIFSRNGISDDVFIHRNVALILRNPYHSFIWNEFEANYSIRASLWSSRTKVNKTHFLNKWKVFHSGQL